MEVIEAPLFFKHFEKNEPEKSYGKFYIGLCFALASTLFIGSSFIIKKIGLQRLCRSGSLRASAGGYGYLTDWFWWLGFISMGLGEIANFIAYGFAPVSMVTPLGAFSILVSALLASKFLNERLNLLSKLGCVLCILGSIVIVLHSPKSEEDSYDLENPSFVFYATCVVVWSMLVCFHYGPKYGNQYIVIYISLCSTIGSLSVMGCKVLATMVRNSVDTSENLNMISIPLLIISISSCVCVQISYLNKALDIFNTTIVTPIYYVCFTSCVILASAILFQEWPSLKGHDILGSICGYLIVVVGIFMLHGFKDVDISLWDVKQACTKSRANDESFRHDKFGAYESVLTRSM